MAGSELAERTAALLSLAAATQERSLSQLTLLAASQVAGCAAAHVTLWRDGELDSQAASHPDAPRLVAVQLACGRGPVLDAIATGEPVGCPDTLTESRWPEFAAAALRMGVRNSLTLSYRGPVVVALNLLGVRPRAISPDQLQLAELLVAYGSALVGAVADYGNSQRTAAQLRDAAGGRAVMDQAKGILMHALGCSAEEALDRMRDVSQRSNIRATEVARRVVAAHSGSRAGARGRTGASGRGGAGRRTGASGRLDGTSGAGQSARGTGQSARGTSQSARGTSQSARGTGQSARGTGQSARGTGPSGNNRGASPSGGGQRRGSASSDELSELTELASRVRKPAR